MNFLDCIKGSEFETTSLPFMILRDGRRCLTAQQLFDDVQLRNHIREFPECFIYDDDYEVAIYAPPGGLQ